MCYSYNILQSAKAINARLSQRWEKNDDEVKVCIRDVNSCGPLNATWVPCRFDT